MSTVHPLNADTQDATPTVNAVHGSPVPAPLQRMSLRHVAPDFYRALFRLDAASGAGLEPLLVGLVRVRASQINRCSFCIDTHSADTRRTGEEERRLLALPAWRETPFFNARERAALALTEAVTLLPDAGVPDDVWEAAASQFTEPELAQLLCLCITINVWNRIGVATRMAPAPLDVASKQ
jgi:AhpD family alkylhydroperoxidase